MTARRSTRSFVSRSFPLVMRLMSSRSSTSRTICFDLPLDDAAGLLDDRVVGPHLPQDAQGVEDGRERVAELVGQQGHELFLAPVGLGQAVRPLRLGLARLVVGQVVHHPGEGVDLLRLVVEGGDGGLAPEPGAVLAHLPADAVGVAVRPGRLEFVLGLAAEDVLGGEEAGEVLADDLVGPVAEEPLGPEVPADQPPVRVDQEEGVLGRVGREQVEPLRQEFGRKVDRFGRRSWSIPIREGDADPHHSGAKTKKITHRDLERHGMRLRKFLLPDWMIEHHPRLGAT